MDYRQALKEQMEQYYQLTLAYRQTTVDAMTELKRRSPFQKKDYSPYIQSFQKHKADAEKLEVKDIAIPESDEQFLTFAALLMRSITSFILLCEENVRFYDVTDRKQYRKNQVSLKEYADAGRSWQGVLEGAVKDLEKLEDAYKECYADDFSEE